MLTLASTMTGGFSWEALKAINADVPEAQLLDLLEEALAAQLIAERKSEGGTYDFTHALIRQTLYDELSTPRRVLLHRQIGEALERLYANNIDAHLPGAGAPFLPGRTRRRRTEGDRRMRPAPAIALCRQLAYEEAVNEYQLALQALDLGGGADDGPRYTILAPLAEAHGRAGNAQAAVETAEQALILAERMGDPAVQGEAAVGFFEATNRGAIAFTGAAFPALKRALAALGTDETPLTVRLLECLSSFLIGKFDTRVPGEKLALAQSAKDIADRIGDTQAELAATRALHEALLNPAGASQRLALTEEWQRLAQQAGDRQQVTQARSFRLTALAELGEMDRFRDEITAVCDLADAMRQPFFAAWRPIWSAALALPEGRFADAEQFIALAGALLARSQHAGLQAALVAQLYDHRRALGRLGELAVPVAQLIEQTGSSPILLAALSFVYLEDGRLEDARSTFERLAANDFADVPADINTLAALQLSGEMTRRLDDAKRAKFLYEIMLPYADRQIVVANGAGLLGSAAYLLGELAATMSHWEDAERHFEHALAFNERIHARPWFARTCHEYARMLHERGAAGDDAKASDLLTKALATFDELGMKKDLERALALKLELQGVSSGNIYTSIDSVARAVEIERPEISVHPAPDGTVTLMFSDIEDSTVLTERLGDQAWQELLRKHNALIREQIGVYDGYEVKTMGDGFMVAFQSARKGLDCAIAIQRAFDGHNAADGEHVKVRIGLHAGEAIKDGDDFYGKNVIMASRVAGKAAGGEILVSSLLHALVESNVAAATFAESREVELKGLSGTHTVYAVSLISG